MAVPFVQIIIASVLLGLYAEVAPDTPFHPWLSPVAAIGIVLAPQFLGRLFVEGVRRRLRRASDDVRGFVRQYVLSSRILRASVLASYAAAIFVAHWPRTVTSVLHAAGAENWPLVPEALGFAPFLVAWVAALAPSYDLQALLRSSAWTFREYAEFQARGLLYVLIPLAMLLALADGVRESETLVHWLGIFGYLQVLLLVVPVLLLLVVVPIFLRRVYGARPLPASPLRTQLEEFSRTVRFRCRDFLVLRTSGSMINALIVGVFPRVRYVLFTDALLATLTPDEIRAVLAHEVGHAKRHHLAIYVAFAVTGFTLFFVLVRFVFPVAPALLGEDRPLGWVAVAAFFLVYWGVVFGYLSRRLERDADVFGATTVGSTPLFVGTLDRIAKLAGNVRRLSTWRHFSIAQRIEFLEAAARDPSQLRRANRAVRALLTALALVFLASLVFIASDVRGQHEAGLGRLAFERRDLAAAESHMRRAIERTPSDPIYHRDLAVVLWDQGRHDEAMDELGRALALVPSDDVAEEIRKDLADMKIETDPPRDARSR